MALFSIIVVNQLFPNDYIKQEKQSVSLSVRFDSLNNLRHRNPLNLDSNFYFLIHYFDFENLTNDSILNIESVQRGYRRMFASNDVDSMNIGKTSLSFIKYVLGDLDSAKYYIKKDFNPKLKYSNYILGLINTQKGDNKKGIEYFRKESKLEYGFKDKSYEYLVKFYNTEKDYDKLSEIFFEPSTSKYIDIYLATDLYFLNGELSNYYLSIFQILIKRVNIVGVLAAILIMIVWVSYLNSINLFDNVPRLNFILILSLSMLLIFLVFPLSDYNKLVLGNTLTGEYWNDFKYSIFGIGLIEEVVKIIPLLLILWTTKWAKEPYHYIFYACTSALGFALIENILYFQKHYTTIIHARSLTSAVGHMIFSSVFAYGFVLVKFKFKKPSLFFPAFLLFGLAASFSHGLYDYWLFMDLNFFFYLYFFISIGTWSKVVNNTINNSSNFKNDIHYDSARIQMNLVLALTGILFFEYFSVGVKYGSSIANDSIVYSIFNGSLVLLFLGSKLSSLDVVKNYWIPFKIKLNPFSGQVLTQNFVNKDILIKSLPGNDSMCHLIPNDISGKIVDRLILYKRNQSSKLLVDPYWFLVRLDSEVAFENSNKEHIIIKFKEGYESLNEGKNFWVMVASVPDLEVLDSDKILRNQFPTYGWALLNEKVI